MHVESTRRRVCARQIANRTRFSIEKKNMKIAKSRLGFQLPMSERA